ncbi:MAG TPA: AAA family ATPase, partial [Planctomycetota bacterium]|nr:AAA family ATPase [Planctomycetota bacterium]
VKFTRRAINEIYEFSKGIPRLINIICDSALLTCFVRNVKVISQKIVEEVVHELGLDELAADAEPVTTPPAEAPRAEMNFQAES